MILATDQIFTLCCKLGNVSFFNAKYYKICINHSNESPAICKGFSFASPFAIGITEQTMTFESQFSFKLMYFRKQSVKGWILGVFQIIWESAWPNKQPNEKKKMFDIKLYFPSGSQETIVTIWVIHVLTKSLKFFYVLKFLCITPWNSLNMTPFCIHLNFHITWTRFLTFWLGVSSSKSQLYV